MKKICAIKEKIFLLFAAVEGTEYLIDHAISGEEVSAEEFFATTTVTALTTGKGINGNSLESKYAFSKQVLKTAKSPKRIANYTANIPSVKNTYIKHIGGSIIGGVTYSTLHLEDILESILSFDLRQL